MPVSPLIEPPALRAYFEAWRTHSIERICELFVPSATYEILGVTTFVGIDAIVTYWIDNAARQRDVECGAQRVIAAEGLIAAEWSAAFVRVDLAQRYLLRGYLWIECEGDRIRYFGESYAKSVASLNR